VARPEPVPPAAQTLSASLPLARGRRLALDRPLVMGILNATPDSFSDGGGLPDAPAVQRAALAMLAAGADLLDLGGESTRPGHVPVAEDEELRRVLPVLEVVRDVAPDAVVSIDTSKAAVARQALRAGAHMVNDVRALGDAGLAGVVRDAGCAVVLMRHADCRGPDVVAAARQQLKAHVAAAEAFGIAAGAVVLDPGLGFGDPPGRDVEANLALLRCADQLGLPHPVAVGASRKRFLGTLTGEAEASRRVGSSVAAAVLAVQSGAAMVRVHDVGPTVQALRRMRLRD